MALLIHSNGSDETIHPITRVPGFSQQEIEATFKDLTHHSEAAMRWDISHPNGVHLFIMSERQLVKAPTELNARISKLLKCDIYGPAIICNAKEFRKPVGRQNVSPASLQRPAKTKTGKTLPPLGILVEKVLDADLRAHFQKDPGMASVILGIQACRNNAPINIGVPETVVLKALPERKKKRAK